MTEVKSPLTTEPHARLALTRRGLLLGAGALGAGLVGARARPARAQAGPVRGGKLTMGLGIGQSTDSLDPALASSQVPFTALMTMGERLVDIAPDGSLDLRLAEKVTPNADATVWSFAIRKGVTFHDGSPLGPQDVVRTLERHAGAQSKSGAKGILGDVAGLAAEGDSVSVTLKAPNAEFPYLMSDFHLVIQPDGGFADPAAGIFSGPYRLVEFAPGVRVAMERHAGYWDAAQGHFDQVEIIVINDATARNAALQAGQVQIVNRLEPKIVDLLSGVPGVQVAATEGRGFYCLNMFCDTAPFDNADLRMALKLAVNREEMVQKVLRGYGAVGNDIPVNRAYPLFDDSLPQRAYDPEQAAFHYRKSGHDAPVVLRAADAAFPGAVDAAMLFQQSAATAGIPVEIRREPDDGYWSDVWNKQPFHMSFWAGRPTQNQMFSTVYLSGAAWNDTRFSNEGFDKLIVQARGELDDGKRKALYAEAALILRDDGGLIVPMFNQFIDAYRSDAIQGWESNPNRELMNGLAAVKCWQA
ncbi:MAG: ABC transporter substrate-binding protein [Rhodobacteraceae bacterium]|jgi:peptide/nickel transport system substrate-binding protein|nr:ABC transporter substrate-binding protein [Paracoccaceae bacterium]